MKRILLATTIIAIARPAGADLTQCRVVDVQFTAASGRLQIAGWVEGQIFRLERVGDAAARERHPEPDQQSPRTARHGAASGTRMRLSSMPPSANETTIGLAAPIVMSLQ